MKIRIFISSILFSLFIGLNAQLPDEMIENGGFEDDFAGWDDPWTNPDSENKTYEITTDAANVYSGEKALAIGVKVFASRIVKLKPATDYVFSVKIRCEEGGGKYPNVVLTSGDVTLVENGDVVDHSNWLTRQFGFQTPEGEADVNVKITLKCWGNTTSNIFFDDLSIKEGFPDMKAPTVPENLEATWVSDDSVRIAWSSVLDSIGDTTQEVFFYRILRTSNPALEPVEVTTTTDTTFLDTDIKVVNYYYYSISAVDKMGNESDTTDYLEVFSLPNPWPPVSVINSTIDEFEMYPNPATKTLYLSDLETGTNLVIYSTLGKAIFEEEITNSEMSIPIERFSPGIYFIQVRGAGNKSSKIRKLIKQ